MISCNLPHHRKWQWETRLIFLNATAEVKAEAPTDVAIALPEVRYDPGKTTHDDIWKMIDEKYGKDAYQELIADYVDKIMPREPDGYKSALMNASVHRYTVFYDRIRRNFMQTADDLKSKFESALGPLREKTQSELAVLKSGVESARDMANFKEVMPDLEHKGDVEDYFENYLNVLNKRYFNADVNEGIKIPGWGIPILDPLLHPDLKTLNPQAYPEEKVNIPVLAPVIGSDVFKGKDYQTKSQNFEDSMETWVNAKLQWILSKPNAGKQDLEAFREEITHRYELYSKIDKNSAIISGADLAALEKAATPPPDAVGRILDERDDQTLQRLEVMQLLNPSAWENAVQMAGNVIIQAAVNGNAEDKFVAAMKKHRKVEDFSDAKSEFHDLLGDISKVGVTETLTFLRDFNNDAQGDVIQFEREVKPPALSYQVDRQLNYLLSGILTPQKDIDKMIVKFMTADLKGRKELIANDGTRDILFRAIRQSTEQYPELYDKQFGSIPDDIKKLNYSPRIEKPTFHDQAAQLQALIILGNQAKVIVSQISRGPEYRGKKLVEDMESTQIPEDTQVVQLGLKFKGPKQPATFRSAADLGGFNTRDLALKGTKMLGVMTVVTNVFQSYSETNGELPDRILSTIENSLTNHGVLTGVALATGAHMAERHKAFLRYPWLSQHERSAAMTAFKLDNMTAKVRKGEVDRFLGNNAEWRTLADPSMDSEKIKELLKQAGKRAQKGEKPIITRDDLRNVIKDESILTTLTGGGRSGRTRYLFYEAFFSSSVKPDVHHVRELCTGSSYISPSPVN